MCSTSSSKAEASPELLEEYRQWKALGAGGIAFDWHGFMFCKHAAATMARNDTTSIALYEAPELYAKGWKEATSTQREAARTSFLGELPEREGPRARAKPFVFPQRERNEDEPQDAAIKAAYQASFDRLGEEGNSHVEWKTSVLEKHGPAWFLQGALLPVTPLAEHTKGEVCHIHVTDLSGHVTLSFADAAQVIEKGWGERHKLSGTEWLHLGYTLVYVPRNMDEVAIYTRIFQAGIDFMKAGRTEPSGSVWDQ